MKFLAVLFFLALSCKPAAEEPTDEGPPLGMILEQDGTTYAGVAIIDITPQITETYIDANNDYMFNGCHDDPDGCLDTWTDTNGNGWFDAVWIGGFGPLRPANGVHDPIYTRALVLSHNGEYIAFVTNDLVGVHARRITPARDALAEDGFGADQLIVTSSHNHQGPDTLGLWGNPILGVPGYNEDYQEFISVSIEDAVRQAAASMEAVDFRVASVDMRDVSPWFNGANFGGKNPDKISHGMIHDGRDPVVVSDQLLVMQGIGTEGTVFTLTNWSGHPETRGGDNDQISSDWVGVEREVLEDHFGGVALHMAESLGGMQSALGSELPLVEEDGTHVYQTCDATAIADDTDTECYGKDEGELRVDDDGDTVP
ncbi:MAG: hypothetical protein HN348_14270, partial [Proteobacteria bacterium]|nr:hypothetical protein [Pseudomonadota bacterium]